MKSLSILLCAALFAASGTGQAAQRDHCPEGHRGRCVDLPAPPAPPTPPAPPALPALPAPPPPPPPPVVPDEAHAACKGKKIGSSLSLSPRKGMTITGTCEQDSKGMYFELQSLSDQS